ncbi:hypothetical protein EJB05_14761, partial [Eragrostis curvula]
MVRSTLPVSSFAFMTLAFAVRRREAELIGPARPTPRETKRLSDIDDQMGLRWHVPLILFYRGGAGDRREEEDPVRVVRRALSEALVPYYVPSGRPAEGSGGEDAGGIGCKALATLSL